MPTQLVARQGLFDYSIGVALMFLSQKLQGQSVPDVSKRFSIPIVGSFDLQLTNIVVTDFACSASSANLWVVLPAAVCWGWKPGSLMG